MRRRVALSVLSALLLALFGASGAVAAPPAAESKARVIVALRDGADARRAASDAAREHRVEVTHVYRHALRGYAAAVPAGRLNALRHDPRVDYVEQDRRVTITAQSTPTGIRRIAAKANSAIDIDGTDDKRVDVDVAVLDTGIDLDHLDLNVVAGVNCLAYTSSWWIRNYYCAEGGDDDNRHGTHVAGTVGALDNSLGVVGVAPGARLHAVKVLDSRGSGPISAVIAGIDWVTANANTIEVANMSLSGTGYSRAERDAIQNAVDNGVAFAVAAGNHNDDAADYSPAAFDNVLTVSALADFNGRPGGGARATCRSDVDDTLANFSNFGDAIDVAAPGVCIRSTYPLEQGGYGTMSGTSMASPHVAGALALLASTGDYTTPGALYKQIIGTGNLGWEDDAEDGEDGEHEPLLDVHTFAPTFEGVGESDDGSDTGGSTDSEPSDVTVRRKHEKVKGK